MVTGLTDAERERIVRTETELREVRRDLEELRKDFRGAIHDLRNLVAELKLALALQGRDTAMAIARPIDKFTGIKLALVGLGGVIVFAVTVVGGVLGIFAFFHK